MVDLLKISKVERQNDKRRIQAESYILTVFLDIFPRTNRPIRLFYCRNTVNSHACSDSFLCYECWMAMDADRNRRKGAGGKI